MAVVTEQVGSMPWLDGAARRAIGLALCLAAASLGAGCYKPTVQDGGFRCNTAGKACPDSYKCDLITMTCRRTASVDARADGPGLDTAGGETVTDGRIDRVDLGAEVACLMPKPGCTPQAAGCDPVCQTGCGCREKCSRNSAGASTCNVLLGSARFAVGATCDISSAGTAMQTDNCDPGLVCVADSCGSRCYQFCRTDVDCPNSTCTRDSGGGVKICDVPFTTCNPVMGMPTGCASTAQGCYLSQNMTDKTLCDCPFMAQGVNQACTLSRDCLPGLVCVDANGSNDFRCRPVCSLATCGNVCASRNFRAVNGSTRYGYCF